MKGIIAFCIATLVSTISADKSLFSGKFQLTSNPAADDYQAFLKEAGYSDEKRAETASNQIVVEISISENTWTVAKVSGKFHRNTIKYELGKEFEEEMVDGRKSKTTVTLKAPNQQLYVQHIVGGPTLTILTEVSKEGYKSTHEVNGKTAKTTWKRL